MRLHVYLAALPGLLMTSYADFHIGLSVWSPLITPNDVQTEYLACPSNYYNCDCWGPHHDRAGYVIRGDPNHSTFFSISGAKSLCGMGQLNFYKRDDGHWDFYVNNGDGSIQGKCYSNRKDEGSQICSAALITYTDLLVCYSYICNP
jgi:hypothetical protein